MHIKGVSYHTRWAYGGHDGITASVQYNFAQSWAFAQTSLSTAVAQQICTCGISHYRLRPDFDGPDKDVNPAFNDFGGYKPALLEPDLSSVTALLWVGPNGEQGYMTLTIWFFEYPKVT